MNSKNRFIHRLLLLAAALLAPALLAQWQVNNQVYRGGAANTGSMRYGLQAQNTMPIQSAYTMLPSQVRYATWKSGALPSEVRMQANAIGPLAPSGSIAYIPPKPSYQMPKAAPTQGNFVDTRVNMGGPPVAVAGAAPGWAGFPTAAPVTGSVRYSAPSVPYGAQQITPWSAFEQPSSISGIPIGQALGSPMAGSVKYTP
ncbi:MAG TPA: hypothetical protein VH518_14860 [Tepidisphaeraceae bacterium]|jgi:hypothetical protein